MEAQVFEERVDLSNDMTWRQMIAVTQWASEEVVLVREVRGELDKLRGAGQNQAKICREEGGAAPKGERSRENKRDRQAAAAAQNEAEESDATEEEATRERTTRVGRTTARWHEGCSENRRETAKRDRKRRTP